MADVLPLLYLRGLSTDDFREALPVLLGKDAAGLSPTNITRLTAAWDEEYQGFRRRDLSACDYAYVWVDGIHFKHPAGRRPSVHSGDDLGDGGRDEGAGDARGRLSGEHGELGQRAA